MLRDKKNKTVNIKMWQKYVGMWPRAIVRVEVGGTIRARCERSCAILISADQHSSSIDKHITV